MLVEFLRNTGNSALSCITCAVFSFSESDPASGTGEVKPEEYQPGILYDVVGGRQETLAFI